MDKLLLIVCVTLAIAMPAGIPGTLYAQDNQAAEEIETVEDAGAVEQGGLFQMIGRFHPVVLHFPIAWMILLVLLELAVMTGIAVDLNRWSLALLLLTLVSFVPAVVSGLGLASVNASSNEEFIHTMILHRNFNLASALVLLVAGIVRMAVGQAAGNRAKTGYYILLFAAAGLLVYGSHLGGELVWGEGFLPSLF